MHAQADPGHAYVGRVVDLISGTGTHDTLVVQLATNADDIRQSRVRTAMVPFAAALCPHVDARRKQLLLDPPEGLLDMCSVKKLRRALTPEQQQAKLAALQEPGALPAYVEDEEDDSEEEEGEEEGEQGQGAEGDPGSDSSLQRWRQRRRAGALFSSQATARRRTRTSTRG
jgi:hypothetical protein